MAALTRRSPDVDPRAAAVLAALRGHDDAAVVVHGDEVWYATGTVRPERGRTPLVDLIQGVREAREDADIVLRRRVFVTWEPTELDRAVVQVAARRVSRVPPASGTVAPSSLRDAVPWANAARARAAVEAVAGLPALPDAADEARWAAWLAASSAAVAPGSAPRRQRDRPEVAVLVGPDGAPLAAARNTSGRNRTLHAEVNLVQGWVARTGRPIPAGAMIVCTLAPCRMCAAMIVAASAQPVDVRFLRADPGRLASGTALQRRDAQRPLHADFREVEVSATRPAVPLVSGEESR